jgi:hypothetical protein
MIGQWSGWLRFPDPAKGELLIAPFGPGCYQLRSGKELLLFGMSGHVAVRMTSLLPRPTGTGGARKNKRKQDYVLKNLSKIQYRTIALASREHAVICERETLKSNHGSHRFKT